MERLIFHVDVNSAFLSWEATRRVSQGEPDIRLIPSAIGGDGEKRTGVILAKSIPAKKFSKIHYKKSRHAQQMGPLGVVEGAAFATFFLNFPLQM